MSVRLVRKRARGSTRVIPASAEPTEFIESHTGQGYDGAEHSFQAWHIQLYESGCCLLDTVRHLWWQGSHPGLPACSIPSGGCWACCVCAAAYKKDKREKKPNACRAAKGKPLWYFPIMNIVLRSLLTLSMTPCRLLWRDSWVSIG